MPMVPTPSALSSLSQSLLMALWGVSYDHLIKEEKNEVIYRYAGTTQKWTAVALQPLWVVRASESRSKEESFILLGVIDSDFQGKVGLLFHN